MKTKPSKGAIEAAEVLVNIYGDYYVTARQDDPEIIKAAQIIDDKTGVGELLEALRDLLSYSDGFTQRRDFKDVKSQARAILEKYKQDC